MVPVKVLLLECEGLSDTKLAKHLYRYIYSIVLLARYLTILFTIYYTAFGSEEDNKRQPNFEIVTQAKKNLRTDRRKSVEP